MTTNVKMTMTELIVPVCLVQTGVINLFPILSARKITSWSIDAIPVTKSLDNYPT